MSAHPSYPSRALHKDWRAAYVRAGRRLMALGVVTLIVWVGVVWSVIDGAVLPLP